jgi:hypothetical protein
MLALTIGTIFAVLLSLFFLGIYLEKGKPLTWSEHGLPALCLVAGFTTFGFLMGLLIELPDAWTRLTVTAGAEGLGLTRHGLLFRRTAFVPAAELRELRVGLSAVEAIAPQQVLRIGAPDLRRKDREWIRDALQAAIAA